MQVRAGARHPEPGRQHGHSALTPHFDPSPGGSIGTPRFLSPDPGQPRTPRGREHHECQRHQPTTLSPVDGVLSLSELCERFQVSTQTIYERPSFGGTRELTSRSGFADLAEVWLADLELRGLADGTKQNYRDQVRLHVFPAFEHFTLAEITTGRVEWFLKSQAAVSSSRARRSRTLLNLLFGFALRHDAIARNPVGGTSPLRRATNQPKALTLEQISAIRAAAANWRSQPCLPGPKPDGQVRDIIEVLLGTAMRPGEVLALRRRDIDDGPADMVVSVTGTVVQRKGTGAVRQERPKSAASIRCLPVPEFAAVVLRRRVAGRTDDRTVFANRNGGR